MKAVLWFNIAHYGLRPWPWIIVALCSMLVYPELSDIQARFPALDPSLVGDDLAYPAMLVFLPAGLLGLDVASLAAAYMSSVAVTTAGWVGVTLLTPRRTPRRCSDSTTGSVRWAGDGARWSR